MKQIYTAVTNIFKERIYFLFFFFIAIAFFGVFIFIPVVTIPGNDPKFQLSIYAQKDYAVLIFLSILVGLTFAMQIYSVRKQRKQMSFFQSNGKVAMSGVSGILGSIVGTAACSSCLAFLFGLVGLGMGSVYFVLKYQLYFLIAAIGVMLISLYSTSRNVNSVCDSCSIKEDGKQKI